MRIFLRSIIKLRSAKYVGHIKLNRKMIVGVVLGKM
jgi:hypothetical protein